MANDDMPKTTRIEIIDKASFANIPGRLMGEAVENESKARRLRAHLFQRDRYQRWRANEPEDPELARWHANDEI